MFDETIESVMNDLIQLDIDAVCAYTEALKVITDKDIHSQLVQFREDHNNHIKELSKLLSDVGGKPIKHTQDIKGYIIEGMTYLRSISGEEGALKAMLSNEHTTNKKYQDAMEHTGFTTEIRKLITKNFHDEKTHLGYIQNKLAEYKK